MELSFLSFSFTLFCLFTIRLLKWYFFCFLFSNCQSYTFLFFFSLCSLMSLSSNSLLIIIIICFLRGYLQEWSWKIEEAFIFFEERKKWERKKKNGRMGEEEDFHVDGWILKFNILWQRVCSIQYEMTMRYLFDLSLFRLHYMRQLGME